MPILANLIVRIAAQTEQFDHAVEKAAAKMKRFGSQMEDAGRTLTMGITVPLAGVGFAALKTAGDLEQAEIAFTTMLKSADAAKQHLEELKAFTLKTPFRFPELVYASRLMQAYGFAAAEVVPKLRTIGNAVSALGGGRDVLERVVRSLGEIGTRGRITGEQLRELSRAGIPAIQAVADALGLSVYQTQIKIKAGAVDAETALDALLGYMEKRFGGGMEAQAKTLLGMWSNVRDRLTFMLQDIGKILLPIGKDVIAGFIEPVIKAVGQLATAFSSLPPIAQKIHLGLLGIIMIGPPLLWTLGMTVEKVMVLGATFVKMAAALHLSRLAFTGWLAVIPLVTLGIIALMQSLEDAAKSADDIKVVQKNFLLTKEAIRDTTTGVYEYGTAIQGAIAAAKRPTDWRPIGAKEAREAREDLALLADAIRATGAALLHLRPTSDWAEQWQKQIRKALKGPVSLAGALETLGIPGTYELETTLKLMREANAVVQASAENYIVKQRSAQKLKEAEEQLYGVWEKHKHRKFQDPIILEQVKAETEARTQLIQKIHAAGVERRAQTDLAAQLSMLETGLYSTVVAGSTRAADQVTIEAWAWHQLQEKVEAGRIGLEELEAKLPNIITLLGQMGLVTGKTAEGMALIGTEAHIAAMKAGEIYEAFEKLGVKTDDQYKQSEAAAKRYYETVRDGGRTATEVERTWIAWRGKNLEMLLETGTITKREYAGYMEEVTARTQAMSTKIATYHDELRRIIRHSFDQVTKGIIEAITKAETLGEAFRKVAQSISETILEYVIKRGLAMVIQSLDTLISKLGATGKAMQNWAGEVLGTGGGTATGTAAGGGGDAAAGASAGAGGGALGVVNAVTGISQAITGWLGYFQTRRMEQDIGRMEVTSRGILNMVLVHQESFNTYLPHLADITAFLWGPHLDLLTQICAAVQGRNGPSYIQVAPGAIQVNGSDDPRVSAQRIMRELKLLNPAFA